MLQNVVETINGSAWAQAVNKSARILRVSKNVKNRMGQNNLMHIRTWFGHGKSRVWSVTEKQLHSPLDSSYSCLHVGMTINASFSSGWSSWRCCVTNGSTQPHWISLNISRLWNAPFCSPGLEFSVRTSSFSLHLLHGSQKISERRGKGFHRWAQDQSGVRNCN